MAGVTDLLPEYSRPSIFLIFFFDWLFLVTDVIKFLLIIGSIVGIALIPLAGFAGASILATGLLFIAMFLVSGTIITISEVGLGGSTLIEAAGKGAIAGIIVTIPTPIAGTLFAGVLGAKSLELIG